jgi:tetratricopeptide (TPR) repeat protein
MSRTPFAGFPVLVLALQAAGCETTTTTSAEYTFPQNEQESYDDTKLRNLVEESREYPNRHDIHYSIAQIYYQQEDYRGCAKALKRAIVLDPENSRYHYHLGRVYLKSGDVDLAEVSFKDAVDRTPRDRYAGPHAALGYVLGLKKKFPEAIEEFETCIAIEPENPAYYYFLGAIHDILGQREETIRAFREYLDRGGKTYRKNVWFILEKLGVEVERMAADTEGAADAASENLEKRILDGAPGEGPEGAPPVEGGEGGAAKEAGAAGDSPYGDLRLGAPAGAARARSPAASEGLENPAAVIDSPYDGLQLGAEKEAAREPDASPPAGEDDQ